jgi:hypothetical protein
MANQAQRKIETLAVPGVAIIGHSHGRLLVAIRVVSGRKEFDRN